MKYFDKIESFNFGIEYFDSIQLCAMSKPVQENGYYHVEHEGKLGNYVFLPNFDVLIFTKFF